LAVTRAAYTHRVDVLFNTQFFTPFLSRCPTTMGLQEPAWWTHPEEYSLATRLYQKIALPLSIRKCAHVFPNSTFVLEENREVLRLPIEHATVAYSAADERFQPLADAGALEAFRRRYRLPRNFILVVTRVVHGGQEKDGPLFPGKNPEVAFRAFRRIRDEIGHDLVFAGHRVQEYLEQTEGQDADFDRAHFVGQVPFEESHLLYNAAAIVVNPCVYEGCPNTVLQAMACGRPLIVASAGGSADVAAGAALMSRPMDDRHLAEQLLRVANDPALQSELGSASLTRSREFSWRKSAEAVLGVLVELGLRKAA
jgi:glycosyltransferase involved in cell wall biosynthesis